jgi:propanediol dehydratase large subunit
MSILMRDVAKRNPVVAASNFAADIAGLKRPFVREELQEVWKPDPRAWSRLKHREEIRRTKATRILTAFALGSALITSGLGISGYEAAHAASKIGHIEQEVDSIMGKSHEYKELLRLRSGLDAQEAAISKVRKKVNAEIGILKDAIATKSGYREARDKALYHSGIDTCKALVLVGIGMGLVGFSFRASYKFVMPERDKD